MKTTTAKISGLLLVLALTYFNIAIAATATCDTKEANITADANQVISIWPNGTKGINPQIPEKVKPGNKFFYDIHNPTLTVYRPEKPNRTAVIIIPGGGYGIVAVGVEGVPIAAKFNDIGVTAFILKYRLPATHKHPAQLDDALRAIRWVRHNADAFGIDADKIGVIGFSAGGHLASMTGTLFAHKPPLTDEISKQNARPDFMCLIYPVISAHVKDVAHKCPSKLLPEGYSPKELKSLSSDLNVRTKTPPAFLAHAKDDPSVSYKNSRLMYEALQANNIPAKLNIYEQGAHGGSFGRQGADSSQWFEHCTDWLTKMKFIPTPAKNLKMPN